MFAFSIKHPYVWGIMASFEHVGLAFWVSNASFYFRTCAVLSFTCGTVTSRSRILGVFEGFFAKICALCGCCCLSAK